MSHVLVVDDEPAILRAMAVNLRVLGYSIDLAPTGEAALDLAARHPPDAVILDLGLPGISGIEVIRGLRGWTEVPIIILSAREASGDKVVALDAGADDYVTKPFAMDELLARLRAMTRRTGDNEGQPVVRFGDTTVDLAGRRVTRGDDDVRLTPTEWHLLEVLVRHPGKLLSQRLLLTEVWGPGYETAQGNLRVYMGQLRRKLEPDPSRPRHLLNEPGMGYRFEPEPRPRRTGISEGGHPHDDR